MSQTTPMQPLPSSFGKGQPPLAGLACRRVPHLLSRAAVPETRVPSPASALEHPIHSSNVLRDVGVIRLGLCRAFNYRNSHAGADVVRQAKEPRTLGLKLWPSHS